MIKVSVVDDQALWVAGLAMIIGATLDMEVLWTAENGEEALFKCKTDLPDVVLMDMRMPIMNGVEATTRLKTLYPPVKIIVLTTFNDDDFIFQSLKNGASGYLLKDAKPEVILDAVRSAMRGGTVMAPDVASRVVDQLRKVDFSDNDDLLESLTDREMDIAKAVAQGLNNKEIAEKLFLTEGTVKNHITNILDKLKFRDRTQLAIHVLKSKRP